MSENSPRRERDPRVIAGAILIVVGLLLFTLQYVTGVAYSLIFLVAGGVFLIAYFNKRSYGLLIPACIMLGIGVGRLGEEAALPVDDMSQLGLGIGFVSIYIIDRLYRGRADWWPLIPGAILVVNGAGSGYVDIGRLISKGWPIILVIIGILFMTGKLGTDHRKKGQDPEQGPHEPQ